LMQMLSGKKVIVRCQNMRNA